MWVIFKKEFQERYYLTLIGLVFLLGLQQHSYRNLDARTEFPVGIKNLPWKSTGGMMDFFYPDRYTHLWFFILFGAIVGVMTFASTSRSENWSFLRQRAISPIQIQLGRLAFAFLTVALPGVLYMARQAYWFAKPGNLPLPWTNEYLIIFSLPMVWALAVVPVMALSALPFLKRWMRVLPALAFLGYLIYFFPGIRSEFWHNTISVSCIGALSLAVLGSFAFTKRANTGASRGPFWFSILFLAGILPWHLLGGVVMPIVNKFCMEEVLSFDAFFYPEIWPSMQKGRQFRVTKAGIPVEVRSSDDETDIFNLLNQSPLAGEDVEFMPMAQVFLLRPDLENSDDGMPLRSWVTSIEPLPFETTDYVETIYYWQKEQNLISFYRWDTFELEGVLGREGVGKTAKEVLPFKSIKNIVSYTRRTNLPAPVFWIRTEEGTFLWNTSRKKMHVFDQIDLDRFSFKAGVLNAMGDRTLVIYVPSTDQVKTIPLPKSMEANAPYILYATDLGFAFRELRPWKMGESHLKSHFVFISEKGEAICDTHISLDYGAVFDFKAQQMEAIDMTAKFALVPGFQWYTSLLHPQLGFDQTWERLDASAMLDPIRNLLLKNLLMALLYYLVVFLILKRSKKHVWYGLLIVLAGGPMASALILFHLSVPHAPCPSCGRIRPTHGESCDHCGNAYPEPAVTAWR